MGREGVVVYIIYSLVILPRACYWWELGDKISKIFEIYETKFSISLTGLHIQCNLYLPLSSYFARLTAFWQYTTDLSPLLVLVGIGLVIVYSVNLASRAIL